MAKRKTHDAFYVTAIIDSGTANQRTSYLLGPFETRRAAAAMVAPVRYAANHHTDDPRFAFAAFGVTKLTKPIDKPFVAGRLDLTKVVDDVWINHVITYRSWDTVFSDLTKTEHGSYRSK